VPDEATTPKPISDLPHPKRRRTEQPQPQPQLETGEEQTKDIPALPELNTIASRTCAAQALDGAYPSIFQPLGEDVSSLRLDDPTNRISAFPYKYYGLLSSQVGPCFIEAVRTSCSYPQSLRTAIFGVMFPDNPHGDAVALIAMNQFVASGLMSLVVPISPNTTLHEPHVQPEPIE